MDDSLDLLKNWIALREKKDRFAIPADAVPVYIELQNPHKEFMPEFLQGLFALEHAMAEKGYDPATFSIRKSRIGGNYPGVKSSSYTFDYTIAFQEHSYSVRREGDMMFLAYFSTLVLSDDHEDFDEARVHRQSFFRKLVAWLEADATAPPLQAD